MGFYTVGKTMGLGFPGTVSRGDDYVVTNRPVASSATNGISFGGAVVLNTDNTYSPFGASNVAADFAGIAVREVHQGTAYLQQNTSGNYAAQQPCDVLERGAVSVYVAEGTPTAGGKVYIVTVLSTSGGNASTAIGDLITTSAPAGTGGTAVELTNCQWKTGNMDANNTAELQILSRNKA